MPGRRRCGPLRRRTHRLARLAGPASSGGWPLSLSLSCTPRHHADREAGSAQLTAVLQHKRVEAPIGLTVVALCQVGAAGHDTRARPAKLLPGRHNLRWILSPPPPPLLSQLLPRSYSVGRREQLEQLSKSVLRPASHWLPQSPFVPLTPPRRCVLSQARRTTSCCISRTRTCSPTSCLRGPSSSEGQHPSSIAVGETVSLLTLSLHHY